MSEHTKEPWHIVPHPEFGSANARIDSDSEAAWGNFGQIAYATPANARRIVACVNACAGIPDNVLEEAAKCAASGRFGTMAAMYKAQRDELLAALQMALADHMTEVYLHPLRDGTVEAIRCAIANADKPPCA